MADRAYIIPVRNDLDGMGLLVEDLFPNGSQKNLIYDGADQAGYLKYSFDQPGATTVAADSYISGSTNTSPLTAAADDDTTGGGDDVIATQVAQFGLLAYLQERVQPGGVAAATAVPATEVQAAGFATAILALVAAGTPLTITNINTALAGVVADTDLDGFAANSKSFGTVEEILQILSGQVYRVRGFTILGENSGGATGEFFTLAERTALVNAQDSVANGGVVFYAQGGFLERGEPGFRDIRELILSGSVRISAGEGKLAGFAKSTIAFNNPAFDYTGSNPRLPRATTLDGTNLPASGVGAAVVVVDNLGNYLT